MNIEKPETFKIRPESKRINAILTNAYRSREIIKMGDSSFAVVAHDCENFVLQAVVMVSKPGDLPPLESTVRIVPGDVTIWDVAEQFVGVDCRLKAVFMLGETQMVAVQNIGSGQCCCFWASMVRTPEQAKAEERAKAIAEIAACMAGYKDVEEPNEKMLSLSTYLHDHGFGMRVDQDV